MVHLRGGRILQGTAHMAGFVVFLSPFLSFFGLMLPDAKKESRADFEGSRNGPDSSHAHDTGESKKKRVSHAQDVEAVMLPKTPCLGRPGHNLPCTTDRDDLQRRILDADRCCWLCPGDVHWCLAQLLPPEDKLQTVSNYQPCSVKLDT